jgi:hypothetical protein
VLKIEFYTRRHWPTETEAKQAVGTWMEGRYNRVRPNSGVAMISPLRFEEAPHPVGTSRRTRDPHMCALALVGCSR